MTTTRPPPIKVSILWFFSSCKNCQIFFHMTVPRIEKIVRNRSTPAIENSEPNFRKGSTPVIKNCEPNCRFGFKAEIHTELLPNRDRHLGHSKLRANSSPVPATSIA